MASTEDKPPPSGSLVMSVGQVARPGQELRLASVAGAPDMVYPWPLTVGKGGYLLQLCCQKFRRMMYYREC